MANPFDIVTRSGGMETNPNDLDVQGAPLSVARNCIINRDGMIERRKGFKDFSTNLPDFTPEQLFESGGVLYLNLDDGLWYYDTASSTWLRKRGVGGLFGNPNSAVYVSGKIYFSQSHSICELDLSTGYIRTIAGRQGVSGTSNGTGQSALFNSPSAMVHLNGALYVCDTANHAIRQVIISSGIVTTYSGLIGTSGSTDSPTPRYNNPAGICFDGTDFYISDSTNHTIRRLTTGATLSTFAGTAGASGSGNGTGSAARFNLPAALCFLSGSLYICDSGNDILRAVTVPGAVSSTIAGALDFSTRTGSVTPVGSDLYVGDTVRLRRLVLPGTYTTIAGQASTGSADGIGTSASFNFVQGLAYDGNDLYICDAGNNLIRKIYLDTSYVATIGGTTGISAIFSTTFADGIVIGPPE